MKHRIEEGKLIIEDVRVGLQPAIIQLRGIVR
jgi:hypothetical protein